MKIVRSGTDDKRYEKGIFIAVSLICVIADLAADIPLFRIGRGWKDE